MMLTDRYIAATVAKLPASQRAEVQEQLREAIGDAIDAALDQGPAAGEPARASAIETQVLNDFGDPEKLAATYAERPLHLIGPGLFLQWKRLLVLLLWIVVPIAAVIAFVVGLIDDKSAFDIVGAVVSTAWMTVLTIGFWVTAIFAVFERSRPAELDALTTPWTVDQLSEQREPQQTLSDTIATTVVLMAAAFAIVWQQVNPPAVSAAGEGLPALNPDLWSFILPAVLALIAIELGLTIARRLRGQRTVKLFAINVALNVAGIVLIAVPVMSHDLLNRALFDHLGWPSADFPIDLELQEWGVLAVVAAVAVWDIVDSGLKTRRARRVNQLSAP